MLQVTLYDDSNHSDLIFYYVNSNEPISLDQYVRDNHYRFLSKDAIFLQFERGISTPLAAFITSYRQLKNDNNKYRSYDHSIIIIKL